MGGSSSKEDASVTKIDSSRTSTEVNDNSQSFGLQDVDGSNVAGGNLSVVNNSVDDRIVARALDTVDRSTEESFSFGETALNSSQQFGTNALGRALDFGANALRAVSGQADKTTTAVGNAYANANSSEEAQASEQFQTTIRWLGIGGIGIAAIYIISRSLK